MKQLILIALCIVSATLSSLGQRQTFKGKVTAFQKYPLNKVSIQGKEMQEEIFTDANGYFEITCSPKEKVTFTASGFQPAKLKMSDFNENESISVDLKYKNTKKNFEIATGYGHISSENLTTAVAHLEAGPDYSSYQTILEAIEGRIPGVSVGMNSINIRGAKTLNGGPVDALLVIDGTIVSFGVFVNVPPTDVKSISVLKGASAAARYGSRGDGGVVIIKTKSGGQ